MHHLLGSVLRASTWHVEGQHVGHAPLPGLPRPSNPPVLTHIEAHRSMPWDSTPLIFWGFRLHSTTTSLSCRSAWGTNCTRPLTTVRGSASPTSIFSTYRLSASGCCHKRCQVLEIITVEQIMGPCDPSGYRKGHPLSTGAPEEPSRANSPGLRQQT